MKIKRLRLQNFLSHEDSVLFLDGIGLTLLDGVNGSGKTTCANALYYGLYGETLNDLPVDSISHQGQGNTLVEIDLEARGIEIQIRRYLKHSQHKSTLYVTANGERVSAGTNKETQKKLDGLLGVDALAFRWTCVFHPSEKGFAALTDKDQKAVLETILQTDRFTQAQEAAKDQLRELERQHDASRNRVKSNLAQIENFQSTILDLTSKEKTWSQDRAEAEAKAQKALAIHKKKQPEDVADLRVMVDELQEAWSKVSAEMPATIARQRGLREKIIESRTSISRFQTSAQYLMRQRSETKEINVNAEIKKASTCPACAQDLPNKALGALRENYQALAKERQATRDSLETQAREAEAKAKAAEQETADLETALEAIDKKVSEAEKYQAALTGAQGRLTVLERDWEAWKMTDEVLRAQLARVQEETNPYGDLIISQKSLLQKAEDDIGLAQTEIRDYETRIKLVKFWVDGFGRQGVVSLLLDSVIPVLSARANYYLGILAQGASVDFSTQSTTQKGATREKFRVTASYLWGAASYEGTSDGERRRVDLAVLCSLGDLVESRNGTTIGVRILDEPFGPLDEIGRVQTMRLLKELSKRVGTVLTTSHEDSLKALPDWDKRISVQKVNGVSRLA